MRPTSHLSNVRDRSRSARERSRSLRTTSQQLRDSLENLRAYAAAVNQSLPVYPKPSPGAAGREHPCAPRSTPLDFADLARRRIHNARLEAQALRRRAADLRKQAAEFRARSQNLRCGSACI